MHFPLERVYQARALEGMFCCHFHTMPSYGARRFVLGMWCVMPSRDHVPNLIQHQRMLYGARMQRDLNVPDAGHIHDALLRSCRTCPSLENLPQSVPDDLCLTLLQ